MAPKGRYATCTTCGAEFWQAAHSNHPRQTCSRKCKTAGRYPDREGWQTRDAGTVGAIHELMVAADLMKRGYQVYRAISGSARCDLVAHTDDLVFFRVEVKTAATNARGEIIVPVSNPEKYDVLAMVTHDGTITYRPELS